MKTKQVIYLILLCVIFVALLLGGMIFINNDNEVPTFETITTMQELNELELPIMMFTKTHYHGGWKVSVMDGNQKIWYVDEHSGLAVELANNYDKGDILIDVKMR